MMGGGDYHLGKKGPLFVRRLSVFGCSLIPARTKKGKRGAPEKKMEGTNGPDPLSMALAHPHNEPCKRQTSQDVYVSHQDRIY
jgi:hypothetical protein